MCLGKALTGGYLTFIGNGDYRIDRSNHLPKAKQKCFMHGPTFMANPLACAIACASIDLLLASDWRAKIQKTNNNYARISASSGI